MWPPHWLKSRANGCGHSMPLGAPRVTCITSERASHAHEEVRTVCSPGLMLHQNHINPVGCWHVLLSSPREDKAWSRGLRVLCKEHDRISETQVLFSATSPTSSMTLGKSLNVPVLCCCFLSRHLDEKLFRSLWGLMFYDSF